MIFTQKEQSDASESSNSNLKSQLSTEIELFVAFWIEVELTPPNEGNTFVVWALISFSSSIVF